MQSVSIFLFACVFRKLKLKSPVITIWRNIDYLRLAVDKRDHRECFFDCVSVQSKWILYPLFPNLIPFLT